MFIVNIDEKLNNLFEYIKEGEIAFIEINPNFRLSKVLITLKTTAMQY